jgi:lysophospholipase L1-like esterase
MHVIVGTLPELDFTPLYLNRSYIKRYNSVIYKLSKKMNFDVCDLSGVESHYVDGVHFTHEGNVELAKRFADKILKL